MSSDVGIGLLLGVAGLGLGFFLGAVATPFMTGPGSMRVEETDAGPVARAHAAAARLRQTYRNDELAAELQARAAAMRHRRDRDVATGSIPKEPGHAPRTAGPAP